MRDQDWKSLTLALILILASLGLAGCSEQNPTAEQPSLASGGWDSVDLGALEGEWSSGCINLNEQNSELINYSIKKAEDKLTFRKFSDRFTGRDCKEKQLQLMEQSNGVIRILSEIDTDQGYNYKTEVSTHYTYRVISDASGEPKTEEDTEEKTQLISMSRVGNQVLITLDGKEYRLARLPRNKG